MHIFDALILGIVEGITEFLPVSSTGHLILTSHILNLSETVFTKSFEIIIQLGAILAVVYLYRTTIFKDFKAVRKVCIAFLPTAIIGLTVYSFVKKYLLGNDLIVVISLFVGGVCLILLESRFKKQKKSETTTGDITQQVTSIGEISHRKAFVVGLWQTIAIIPGVSRSAATIIGGELSGISRKVIVEFSFLLAIPTMGAATALDLYKNAHSFTHAEFGLLAVGFITSFIVALLAVKTFLHYIQKHSFAVFGYYRIFIALLYAFFFLLP